MRSTPTRTEATPGREVRAEWPSGRGRARSGAAGCHLGEAGGPDDLVREEAPGDGLLVVHLARGHEARQVGLERLHPVLAPGAHDVPELTALPLADQVADREGGREHLERTHSTPADARHEPLRDDAGQRARELDPD